MDGGVWAVDIGNSKTAIGAQSPSGELLRLASAASGDLATDGFLPLLKQAIARAQMLPSQLLVASVAPHLTKRLLKEALDTPVWLLEPQHFCSLPILYNPPSDLGPDRLANACAVLTSAGPACAVDMGTATTFDVVSPEGFLGGAIALGFGASDTLWQTARLRKPDWQPPSSPLGQSTSECLLSGTLIGYAGMVDTLLTKLARQVGAFELVVITGGWSALLAPFVETPHQLDCDLTVSGIFRAYEMEVGDE